MDFIKKDKLVIMAGDATINIIDLQKTKNYLLIAKKLLMKTNENLKISSNKP